MKSFTVKNTDLNGCSQGCYAKIDSSTSDIVGPSKDIKELNAMLGFDSQYDNITCSSIETLPSKYIS